jgi:hypothetical protein
VKLYSKPKSSQFFWILIWWKEAGERKSKEELKNKAHPAILWVKMRDSWFLKPKLNLGQLIENEAN